jgi:hypothetical protein
MSHHHPGKAMIKICKLSEPPRSVNDTTADKKHADKKVKTPASPLDDEDYEDGDIATPKRDRYGPDDEPL